MTANATAKERPSNIVTATVAIQGVRPILWHVFGPDAIPLEKGEKTGVAGNDPEEWKKTVTYDKTTRQLYVDPSYAFSSICAGARNTKKGRGSIEPLVSSTLQVVDDRILIDRFLPAESDIRCNEYDEPVYVDVRGVRNPSTKGRNVRYRVAAKTGWKASFTVRFDKTIVARALVHAAIIDAGRLSGIGNGRKIGMGRFEVLEFAVLDGE
jgi:hypothetical protein